MIKVLWIICINVAVLVCTPLALLGAQQVFPFHGADPGAPAKVGHAGTADINGQNVRLYDMTGRSTGVVLPGPDGSAAVSPGFPRPEVDANYIAAREMKLHTRELADQLLTTMPTAGLAGYIALPASFVSLDDFEESSSFGRFLAEQLFYEFNQRGFPVREYRYPGNVDVRPGEGEFVLSRDVGVLSGRGKEVVFVTGTYFREKNSIFVNARMIRGTDGLVLRTAQIIVQSNTLTDNMFRRTGGRRLPLGSLAIVDYSAITTPPKVEAAPQLPPSTPFDRGLDIH